MTTTPDSQPAPAEFTYQVTITRRPQGGRGGFSQLASGQLASDAAIAWIEEQRAAAMADGLVQSAADLAADPTSPPAALDQAGWPVLPATLTESGTDGSEPL